MVRKYLTVLGDEVYDGNSERPAHLDWRIKKDIRYPIIGEIGDVWFVWARGHQSAVPKTTNVRIETIDVLRGDRFKDELQLPRKRKKRKSNR